ncbi:metallophosphoesterase [Pontixanthobacter aestiaquae]|uniref:metallophosphoesterase n=1 Tax=Pontixanthobacter aestiaquae TaxID=1509367 RepID=UPI002E264709|nr:metallophosphoesterase [Pontixanthobacter aestiaquae]
MEISTLRLRKRFWIGIILLALIIAIGVKAHSDTMATPVVQRTSVSLASYPADAEPVTIALISDVHVAGPDMPPSRFAEIVEQINALSPDYVMIAGDLVSEKRSATHIYTAEEVTAPLEGLSGDVFKIAVPGNHDHWFGVDGIRAGLVKAGFTVLENEAAQFGPLAVGGIDDDYTNRADLPNTLAAMGPLSGGGIILSHSPDPFPTLPENFGLMLAGHTHCGQIRYPWGGAPATMSDYGERYACGRVDENGNSVIVGAGLGTSLLPVRLFSKPEIWLITIRSPDP